MRATRTFMTLLALAGGASGASAGLSLPVDQEIGTLTCSVSPGTALSARSEAVAECVFVSDREEAVQTYAARLRWQRGAGLTPAPAPARIAWRVLTRKGAERPGMLGGAYADPTTWQVAPVRTAEPVLMGATAKLRQRAVPGAASVVEPQPVVEIELTGVSAFAAR